MNLATNVLKKYGEWEINDIDVGLTVLNRRSATNKTVALNKESAN